MVQARGTYAHGENKNNQEKMQAGEQDVRADEHSTKSATTLNDNISS